MSNESPFKKTPILSMQVDSFAELRAKSAEMPAGPAHMFGTINYADMSRHDLDLAHAIANRWVEFCQARGLPRESVSIIETAMDLITVHLNGCRLELFQLLMSDTSDFVHDLAGISKFLDRRNGHLMNEFRPCFAVKNP